MNDIARPAVVMIIDDEPENLNVLGEILRLERWDVRAFAHGAQALAAARKDPPDLVLMDVRMPGMDGYEMCRQFKADEKLRSIPILFLSACSEASDKIRAFEAGGVDYVTKPFSEKEVLARVRTQLQMHQYQTFLEGQVQQRMQDLVAAHRRLRIWDDAKTDWLNMLSHEMRTPLTGILGIAELLFMDLPPHSEQQSLRAIYDHSRKRIEKLISDACTFSQIDVASEQFHLQQIPIAHALHVALSSYELHQPDVSASLSMCVPPEIRVRGYPDLLYRALTDLFLTAACCVINGGRIQIQAACDAHTVCINISTDGQGLSVQALALFFEIGGQRTLLKGGGDFGLGAALARRIIHLFNGSISVRNGNECGLLLEVTLPVESERVAGGEPCL
jgi:DNA-binding response OmpR family regulator